jgi:hypothetical protein
VMLDSGQPPLAASAVGTGGDLLLLNA